ncbi:MAG: cobalt-precorrin-5B (C(1))-methyltransferase CbiD [Candidatus Humimicrobiaceae bacterium]
MNEITEKTVKHLKRGFTTGTYVSAGALAGVMYLSGSEPGKSVIVKLPCGDFVNISFIDVKKGRNWIRTKSIKDSGDDPDITNGIEIVVETRRSLKPGVKIKAGKGIGTVTLPGLQVEVGKPAINPAPLKMIFDNVSRYIKPGEGYIITISIPDGEKIASRTFNPRLGVIGGLSVLGTTGYVEPKSVDALCKTIEILIDMAESSRFKDVVFVPGNIGEKLCREHFGIKKERVIQVSNYVGHSIEYAAKKKFQGLLLCGHIGKMVKIAAGARDTSSMAGDKRIETLSNIAKICNYKELANDILKECKTAESAAELIINNRAFEIFKVLAEAISEKAKEISGPGLFIRSAVFNYKGILLGTDLKDGELKYWK